MAISVIKTELTQIQPFRILFLQENSFQFVHDKCHLYGWADTYLLRVDEVNVGYASVWGKDKREDRDAIFEFYVLKSYRKLAGALFQTLYTGATVPYMECQSNDQLLSSLFFEYGQNINAEAFLFKDCFQTGFLRPDLKFQQKEREKNSRKDECEYFIRQEGELIATGGLMLNYNMPYADLYYDVPEQYRRQGIGSFMVQELKRAAYEMGRIPAARCNIKNNISKSTLLKGGFKVCGYLLNAEIKKTVSV